jgi:hypothetical protein
MGEFITNTKITEVNRIKSGESGYGPYTIWNFWVEGHKNLKLSYLQGEDMPAPVEGMVIKMLEYEIKKDGRFTNQKVVQFVPMGNRSKAAPEPLTDGEPDWVSEGLEEPKQEPNQEDLHVKPDSSISFYVSYAKDLAVAMVETGQWTGKDLVEIADEVTETGIRMWEKVTK